MAEPAPARWPLIPGLAALAVALLSAFMLERERAGVEMTHLQLEDTPATLYSAADAPAPLVVIAHGFGGSRQMMEAISLTLARSGFAALAFDFHGHGRHALPMSPEVDDLDGTTAQLAAQTRAVATAALELPETDGLAGLVGHSMATDVIIRAARDLPGVPGLVAISMYSEAVTDSYPRRLLIVSGEWEARLREVALEAVHMVDADAAEGETARDGAVARRAVAAPNVEHVGVLYDPVTLAETRDWLAAGLGREAWGTLARTGPWLAALMISLVVAFGAVSRLIAHRAPAPTELPVAAFAVAVLLPALPAVAAAVFIDWTLFGFAGFGRLAAFFGVWGVVQVLVLRVAGWRPAPLHPWPALLLGLWALGVFAVALDRYGAAFLPAGERLPLAAALLIPALPFALADWALVQGAPLWRRLAARLVILAALGAAIFAVPDRLGLVFTVLPVLLLYWLAYGTMARWTAGRAGETATALPMAVVLAWSIAASTPLFAAP